MCKKKGRLYTKAKKTGAGWEKFVEYQKLTQTELNKAHWRYINGVLVQGLEEGDQKPFWRYIRSQQQDNQGVSALRSGSQLYSDAMTKARLLSEQFSSVFTKDTPESADIQLQGPQYPPLGKLAVNEAGVCKLLKNLNPGKASGPDEIPTRLLKTLADEVSPVVTGLIHQSLNSGWLPKAWKEAWITPVFKGGARCDPANYRPISLTSVVCKLAEHVLSTHIRGHLDQFGILTPANHGFRSKHSCESQLLLTTHDLLKHRDLGHSIDVGILDFSKAFDTVPHKRLINKLRIYGIHGEVLSWIESFLSYRQQLVLCDGVKSEHSLVTSGVPQGTVLGPLLFLLYINDMPSVVDPGTSVRLFADDTLIYRVIHSIEDQVVLQRDLARLEQWASTWGMVFNASKCHIMHISRPSCCSHQYMYQFRGIVLSSVTSEKYLGVYLNHDLKWSHHIDQVAAKAARKLGFVRCNLRGAPVDCKKLAYVTLVRSGMEYASVIWDPPTKADSNKLEKIQRTAARWILSSYSYKTSVTSLLQQLQLESLEERRKIQRLAFMYKILNDQVAVPATSVDLTLSSRPSRGVDANQQKLVTVRCHTEIYRQSYCIRTVKDWNTLPQSIVSAGSLALFKSRLASHAAP